MMGASATPNRDNWQMQFTMPEMTVTSPEAGKTQVTIDGKSNELGYQLLKIGELVAPLCAP